MLVYTDSCIKMWYIHAKHHKRKNFEKRLCKHSNLAIEHFCVKSPNNVKSMRKKSTTNMIDFSRNTFRPRLFNYVAY